MKNFFFKSFIIGIIYFFLTFLYSSLYGLPPFNRGIVIGYPAIYYQFYISESEKQFGFTGIFNLFINLLIIIIIVAILKILNKKKSDFKPDPPASPSIR